MTPCFTKISVDVIDMVPDFHKLLKAFIGPFRYEAQNHEDAARGIVTISFHSPLIAPRVDGGAVQCNFEIVRHETNSGFQWTFKNLSGS